MSTDYNIKLSKMVLIRSGKFAFADFNIESPVHLSGGNRNGKTTLINAIQLAICYDLKECSWDGHSVEATKKHYFGQGAYILFEFQTAVGPHCLMIRGLGALDKWGAEYEHWHGMLDVEKFMDFHENGDPLSPRKWDEIQKYLLKHQSKRIKDQKEFNSFLVEDIGLLRSKKRNDLKAFRMLFKDILGFSSIEDQRLRDLFVGMWTNAANRRIDLSDKESQLNELVHESNVLSSFEENRSNVKQLVSDYDEYMQNVLDLSAKVNPILASRDSFVTKLLDEKSHNQARINILETQIDEDRKVLGDMQVDIKQKFEKSGQIKKEVEDLKNELRFISKIDVDLEMKIYEFQSELDLIVRALAMQSSSRRTNYSLSNLIERTKLNIKSTEAEIAGEMTLKKALANEGFSSEDLSVLSVVFNDDLLSVIPTGALSKDTVNFLRNILLEYSETKLINFETLTLDLSDIPTTEISEQLTESQLTEKLIMLKIELTNLEQDKLLADKIEQSSNRKKELIEKIETGKSAIKRQKNKPIVEAELKMKEESLKELLSEITLVEAEQQSCQQRIRQRGRQIEELRVKLGTIGDRISSIDEKVNLIDQYDFIIREQAQPLTELSDFSDRLTMVVKECSVLSNEKTSLVDALREMFVSLNRIYFMSDLSEGIGYLRSEDEQFEDKKQIQESNVRAFFASLTDNLQRFMESIQRIENEVKRVNRRLSSTTISNLESVSIKVNIIDSNVHNLIKSVLEENAPQKTLFFQSEADVSRLESLMKRGELTLSSILGLSFVVTDDGQEATYPNLKKIESNGTTLAIKVAIYSEIIGGMLADGASIPIFIDEVGDLDDDNFDTIIKYIIKRNLNPVTATPRVTWVIPDFYHLVGTGNDKILDDNNRSSWKRMVELRES